MPAGGLTRLPAATTYGLERRFLEDPRIDALPDRDRMILAIVAPFLIGSIFKFLLLVPMPTEGMVALALDAVWYSVF